MKLNVDLIRDILLTIENETGEIDEATMYPKEMLYNEYTHSSYPLLKDYTFSETLYHLMQIIDIQLIVVTMISKTSISIIKPTMLGHDFIAGIRNEQRWNNLIDKQTKDVSLGLSEIIHIITGIAPIIVSKLTM